VRRNRAARLAEQEAAQRVVAPQRLHLLEDRRPCRRRDSVDDDVANLPTGVATDDGNRAPGTHRTTLSGRG